jgi:retrograde regulation protein 2
MPTIQTSMMEDLSRLSMSDMSDFEEILTPDEADSIEWGPSSPESPSPAPVSFTARERRHPPWSGHRDRLIGIVDMGR